MSDNMKGLDTFDVGFAAAEAKYTAQLSATQQKLEAAEAARDGAIEQYLESQKAWRAAEARIKASQEQEPYGWFDTECNQMFFARHERNPTTEIALYTIQPEVAELQRENAELTRKLAEQQARKFKRLSDVQWVNIVNHPEVLKYNNYEAEDAVAAAFKLIEAKLEKINTSANGSEELTKLLAEAKSKAVPEDIVRDAARYNWIRDAGATFYTDVDLPTEAKHHVCEFAMDDAIDKAMLAAAPQPETDRGSNEKYIS